MKGRGAAQRIYHVGIRLTREERKLLDRLAQEQGRTKTEIILEWLRNATKQKTWEHGR